MRTLLSVIFMATLSSAALEAADQSAMLQPVQQFVAGFNKGDTDAMTAACEDKTSIIDEFPPYEWHGSLACEQWVHDFNADARTKGITATVLTLGKPRHVELSGDRAYLVLPASYTYKLKGKPARETGASFTLVLRHGNAGWRIIGWAWAKP